MDEVAAQKLEESIKHWEENVAAESPKKASVHAGDCALCEKYCPVDVLCTDECEGCPVFKSTGRRQCCGTPYYKARDAHAYWDLSPRSRAARDRWRIFAQAELDFLKSLRTEESS